MSRSHTDPRTQLVAELLELLRDDRVGTWFDEPTRRLTDGSRNPEWDAMRDRRRRIEAVRRELLAVDRPRPR